MAFLIPLFLMGKVSAAPLKKCWKEGKCEGDFCWVTAAAMPPRPATEAAPNPNGQWSFCWENERGEWNGRKILKEKDA